MSTSSKKEKSSNVRSGVSCEVLRKHFLVHFSTANDRGPDYGLTLSWTCMSAEEIGVGPECKELY